MSTRSTTCSSTRKPSCSRSDLATTMNDASPEGPPADAAATAVADPPASKAGRDLRAAVGVGLLLAGLVIGTLVVDARAFLAVVVVAVSYGAWEVRRAVATKG